MSKWNGKKFSVYTSDEKSALGLIKELGEQTNYNTDELEQVKISDSKKVSHQEMQETYKINKDANFTGSWHGIKKPTASQEGLQATVDKIVEEDIPNINSQLETIETLIDNVLHIQDKIDLSKGNVKFENKEYNLISTINLKGNTTYDGNNCTIKIRKNAFIKLLQGEKNITFKNFNFVGDLKYTKVLELLEGGTKIKCENNVFEIGDILGASIYGKTDKPYVTITNFDGTYYYLNKTLSENGNILNSDFGNIVGTFDWGALINGGKDNDNIVFENCTFNNSFGYAITLPNTSNVKIERCKFSDNGLDFLLFSAETKNVNNIEIKSCVFDKSIDFGKQGIVANSSGYILEDIIIELNDFSNISESAISFGYAQGRFKNITIKNNRFRNNILYDIHISGDVIDILNNIFEDTKQCCIRMGDKSNVIYPNTSVFDNITIKNNKINAKNGIVITPMRLENGNILYPWHCDIDFNSIRTEFLGIEYGGIGLNVRNNFIKCDKNTGSPNYASTILINNINGVKNENINIINNQFEGQIELKWLDTKILNIKDNIFNKALLNKMIRIQDMSSSQLTETMVKIQNNVFYKSPSMSLQTGKAELKAEYSLNKIIEGSIIATIPFMKGKQCYYDGTVNNWKHSSNNNNAITKDNYIESNGKFIYVANDGSVKATDDVTVIS